MRSEPLYTVLAGLFSLMLSHKHLFHHLARQFTFAFNCGPFTRPTALISRFAMKKAHRSALFLPCSSCVFVFFVFLINESVSDALAMPSKPIQMRSLCQSNHLPNPISEVLHCTRQLQYSRSQNYRKGQNTVLTDNRFISGPFCCVGTCVGTKFRVGAFMVWLSMAATVNRHRNLYT